MAQQGSLSFWPMSFQGGRIFQGKFTYAEVQVRALKWFISKTQHPVNWTHVNRFLMGHRQYVLVRTINPGGVGKGRHSALPFGSELTGLHTSTQAEMVGCMIC